MLMLYKQSSIRYLLRWDLECCSPHVNLLVNIDTRNDKEDSRPPGAARHKSAKSEDDCPLILLNNLASKLNNILLDRIL